jgi:hypothetical protein
MGGDVKVGAEAKVRQDACAGSWARWLLTPPSLGRADAQSIKCSEVRGLPHLGPGRSEC